MTNPTYKCPHCKKDVEIELTKSGNLILNGSKLSTTEESK